MKNKHTVIQTLSLISQLGISMIAPIILCTVAGAWLEEKFFMPFTIPFLILGVFAGGRNVYVLVRHVSRNISGEEEED